ncbi:extracellular solute-binding protein [Paenibacillus sp. LMG 31461]|uniref:Extracellular solute-binding protein n=1 Tax=Paenibacillus plantarum TaxID=2654975 RepID=A0ABX1XDR3_9BACL|nr:extracellular solute-binding protein [Paenibacillus plantarum]NOU66612.1 extracellular solute-binding protein [Paenibacillus plantarum]
MTNKHSRKTFRQRQEDMLQQLRNEISSGIKATGDYLPSEKTLSEQFGLSNKTVRQVLDMLVDEQLIEKIPRVGNLIVNLKEQKSITLRLGHHESTMRETELLELLAAFHKEYPHIRVQLVTLPNNSPEMLKQYIDFGLIDVMTLNDAECQKFVETGNRDYLTPLEKKPDMYSFLSKAFMEDGELLAQPFIFSPSILCYNRDHFKEKGLLEPDSSWNWDECFETAEKLAVENERIGFHFSVSERNRFAVFLLQNGAVFERNAAGNMEICGTPMMEGIRYYKELISNRLTNLLSEQDASFRTEELFAQGKVSMMITTYLGLNHIRKSNIHYEVAPLPNLKAPATLLITIGLAVNQQSPNLEAARLLVDFLTDYKAQLIIRQKTVSLPSLKTAAEWVGKEIGYRPSRFMMYREIMPTFRYGSELGLKESEWRTFFNEVLMYWSGLETEESMCTRLEGLL